MSSKTCSEDLRSRIVREAGVLSDRLAVAATETVTGPVQSTPSRDCTCKDWANLFGIEQKSYKKRYVVGPIRRTRTCNGLGHVAGHFYQLMSKPQAESVCEVVEV